MSFILDPFRLATAGGGSGYVQSVQQVSITIASGATSGTATISSVDTSKSFLVFGGPSNDGAGGGGNANASKEEPRIELTNATTVTAYRDTSTTTAVTINANVIEGKSTLVSSVQHGTVALSGVSSNTTTITSVDTSRSVVVYLGHTSPNTSASARYYNIDITLTNSTTVTATAGISSDQTIGFCVVEFAAVAVQSRQQFREAYTTSNTTDTKTITSVTQGNTVIFYGGQTSSANSYATTRYALQLTSSTNVNLVRGGTSTSSRTVAYTVLEFAAGVLKSNVQRGTIDLTSATSNTATITSVDTSKACVAYTGMNTSNNLTNQLGSNIQQKVAITNATTVTGSIGASNADTKAVGYEVWEFN